MKLIRHDRRVRATVLGFSFFTCSAVACAPIQRRTTWVPRNEEPLTPAATFPSRERLEQIVTTTVPAPAESDSVVSVERWTLDEGALDHDAERPRAPEQVPWLRIRDDVVAASGSKVRASPAFDCLAAEAGHFALANGGDPDTRLTRFMAARCGVYAPAIQVHAMMMAVPADASNDALVSNWGDGFARSLRSLTAAAQPYSRIGVWFVRDDHRAGVVVATGHLEAALARTQVGGDGVVVLAGKLTAEKRASRVFGVVNQGPRGVAPCEGDPARTLPRFRLRCPLATNDTQAWIDVLIEPEGRVLAHPVARVLAHRGTAPPEFVAPSAAESSPPAPGAFGDVALLELNRARGESGLRPLALARQQSTTNTRLAAPLFDAKRRQQDEVIDLIALGLLAGWDVPGVIRNGAIVTATARNTHDPSAWLAEALDTPLGRSVLLAPDAVAIAFGAALDRPLPGVGVVATTYSFFHPEDCVKAKTELLDAIRKRRAERGLPSFVLMSSKELTEQADLIRDHLKPPGVAVVDAMNAIGRASGVSVTGRYMTGNSLEIDDLPYYLLTPRLELAIAVTYARAPGAAWGQYVVLLVTVDHGMDV